MDRRDFIKASGATAAAAVGATVAAEAAPISAPAVVSGTRELRLGMPWDANGRGFDDSARRLAQWIATASGGRYRLTVAPEAATAGGLHARRSRPLSRQRPRLHRPRSRLRLPGRPAGRRGMRPTYLNAWLMAGGGQALWDDLSAPHGFKPLPAGHSGARSKLWSREPIPDAASLAGLRIAAYGLAADVVRELGAEPVAVPMHRLGEALASGAVDAVEWGGTISGFAANLHAAARHCLRPGLARNGFSTVLAVRSAVWSSFSEADRALFAAGAAHELNTVVAESLPSGRRLGTALAERHAIAFAPAPSVLRVAAAAAAGRVIAGLATSSPAAQRMHMSYTAFRAGLPAPRRPSRRSPGSGHLKPGKAVIPGQTGQN